MPRAASASRVRAACPPSTNHASTRWVAVPCRRADATALGVAVAPAEEAVPDGEAAPDEEAAPWPPQAASTIGPLRASSQTPCLKLLFTISFLSLYPGRLILSGIRLLY